jgi:hypothetical protein
LSSSSPSPYAALKQSVSTFASEHPSILSFWTPERIQEAIANSRAPSAEIISQEDVEAVSALMNQELMDEIIYPGQPPKRSLLNDVSENEDGEVLPVTTLSPDNWLAGAYTGKIFYQTSTGVSKTCTGVVVPSTYKNLLFTAPQCVYNKTLSTFNKNWVFIPSWRNGAAPGFPGTFTVKTGYVPNGYITYTNSSQFLFALGILQCNKNSDGFNLEDSTLSPSVRFGGPTTSETRYLIGYAASQPADSQYYWSGASLSLALATSTASGILASGYGTNPPGAVQWFDFEENFGSGTIATISSFTNANYVDYSFGSYFGTSLNSFYTSVQAASGPSSSSRSKSKTRSRSRSKSRSKSHSKA